MIGSLYKYPERGNTAGVFKLVEILDTDVYIFACGHRVSGSVFRDMVMVVNPQLELDIKNKFHEYDDQKAKT
ncbi:MAG TPA: hypothetical protein VL728_19650 [Cyclobacteriaceae bacterium]|jgi:hypothetical protein|nr:hypothetical protein [Cyclobacteriaceae bacterium]